MNAMISNGLLILLLAAFMLSTEATASPVAKQKIQLLNKTKQASKIGPLLRARALQNRYKTTHAIDSKDDTVLIDAMAIGETSRLLSALQTLGLQNGIDYGRMVSGRLPVQAIHSTSRLAELHHMSLHRSKTHTGAVTSEGVQAMQSDIASSSFSVDGSGVIMGVISDSYDCYSQSDDATFLARSASHDKASGDLPAAAYALEEAQNCLFATDEGRALMQVVHDIAPGAELVFLSGTNGIASTASGIVRLVDEIGVHVIVDDSFSSQESYFQDGPIAQAIDYAASQSVVYITATGNSGRLGYQSAYQPALDNNLQLNAHDFDPGPGIDIFQAFSLPPGESIDIDLQWASPAYSVSGPPGASSDLDIFILNADATDILASGTEINLHKDPIEFVQFSNPENSTENTFNLLITKAAGPDPSLLKYILQGRFNGRFIEYASNSGTVVGRANSAHTIAVGAADYSQTPAFGASSPVLQNFSSAGGDTPILFDRDGQLLASPLQRQNPHIVGPDNVNNTFFLFSRDGIDADNDGLPNFLGTSASAPHIAGVVALLLELNPDFQPQDILAILEASAVDMVLRNTDLSRTRQTHIAAGYDNDSGAGFVNAQAALTLAASYPASAGPPLSASSDINTSENSPSGGGAMSLWSCIILFVITVVRRRYYYSNVIKNN